jgi:ATP-dependent protease Clp ATPase subunit
MRPRWLIPAIAVQFNAAADKIDDVAKKGSLKAVTQRTLGSTVQSSLLEMLHSDHAHMLQA